MMSSWLRFAIDLWIHVESWRSSIWLGRDLTRGNGSMVVRGYGAVLALNGHSMWLRWLHEVVRGLSG